MTRPDLRWPPRSHLYIAASNHDSFRAWLIRIIIALVVCLAWSAAGCEDVEHRAGPVVVWGIVGIAGALLLSWLLLRRTR